jgi:hypothetical protein
MRVDGNIGGSIDGTGGADLAGISDQVAAAERVGYAGVWTTEVSRDPFLPLLLAADRSRRLTLGTAVAVAFARNPMTVATIANDLQARIAPVGASMISSSLQSASSSPRATPGIGPPDATPHPRRLAQAHRWDVPSRTAGRYFGLGPWGYLR